MLNRGHSNSSLHMITIRYGSASSSIGSIGYRNRSSTRCRRAAAAAVVTVLVAGQILVTEVAVVAVGIAVAMSMYESRPFRPLGP